MIKDMFWELIDKSGRDVGKDQMDGLSIRRRMNRQMDRLLDRLKMIAAEEIVEFQCCFEECVRDAFRWDLWAVAWIVNGGCSDDGFDYFLGWLIAQGREYYHAALADPETAARRVKPGEFAECSDMWSLARRAYEARTGKGDFYEQLPNIPRTIQGKRWSEEEVGGLFPDLAKKFALS
jgi:hypothetical protein